MTRSGRWISCLCAALLFALPASATRADDWGSGEVQVQLRPGVSIATINARYGTTTLDSLPPLYLLAAPEGQVEDEVIHLMDPDLDIAEAEYSYNNETPEGTRQMTVAAVGGTISDYLDQHLAARLRLDEAHQHSIGEGVIVAVLDTGVLASHPALGDAVLPGYDFVGLDSNANDESDGIDNDLDGETDEGAGHGTMIAGIVHLVAPGAQILPVRVLNDEGRGETFAVAKGIRYALEHGADVINLSLGLNSHSFILGHELELADSLWVPIVAATGNDSLPNLLYPARSHDVLAVTALDSSDVKATFANWHSEVAVAAPGVGVFAPFHDGGYAIGAGTSFASPFVAGQCALIYSLNPGLAKVDVVAAVRLGVAEIYQIPENQPFTGELGTGRFDALLTFQVTPVAASIWDGGRLAGGLRVHPNPARALQVMTIRAMDATSRVAPASITVCDATGRIVRRLDTGGQGLDSVRWDGRDAQGRPVPAGSYFMSAGRGLPCARVVLVQ